MSLSPTLCRPLGGFDDTSWSSIEQAFSGLDALHFAQSWLPASAPEFRPGQVRLGWQEDALWAFAELQDDDIFNAATKLNEPTWRLGDVFEIFLRPQIAATAPVSSPAWFEFHITPENQILQLRWPGPEESFLGLYRERGIEPFLISPPVIATHTQVLGETHVWRALVKIPAQAVTLSPTIRRGDQWLVSCSRYDATRGASEPVLSSTSAHAVAKFDTQDEWTRLHFD